MECCNSRCEHGSWFHKSCVPPITGSADDDWFCSDECDASGGYVYCICKRRNPEEDAHMIVCELGYSCKRHTYYHPSCLGKTAEELPGSYILKCDILVARV